MKYLLLSLPALMLGQTITLTPNKPVATPGSTVTIPADRPVAFSLTGAGSISVKDNHTVTYIPPATIAQPHVLKGCMVEPADSIFNTRIDNLPVHPQSAAWTP